MHNDYIAFFTGVIILWAGINDLFAVWLNKCRNITNSSVLAERKQEMWLRGLLSSLTWRRVKLMAHPYTSMACWIKLKWKSIDNNCKYCLYFTVYLLFIVWNSGTKSDYLPHQKTYIFESFYYHNMFVFCPNSQNSCPNRKTLKYKHGRYHCINKLWHLILKTSLCCDYGINNFVLVHSIPSSN